MTDNLRKSRIWSVYLLNAEYLRLHIVRDDINSGAGAYATKSRARHWKNGTSNNADHEH